MTRSHAVLTLVGVAALTLTSAGPPDHLAPCLNSPFVGITQTLPDDTIVGEPDASDWGCAGQGGSVDAVRVTAGRQVSALDVPVPPPGALCFHPAAPNPATTETRLLFALPAEGRVTLLVYGRHQGHGPRETFVARTLFDRTFAAGFYTVAWDLKDETGVRVDPGVYRAVLVAGDEALCGDIEVQ